MINAPQLLADLTRQLKRLESDLLQRITEQPKLGDSLRAEWQAARDAERCAETFETWADQLITQAGVHWLLSGVFLRFIEDNQLVDRPWLGGTPESGRLALARDRHEAYFREHPTESDRDYLLAAFHDARRLPGLHTFFDEAHNPVFRLGVSGDAAMTLLSFWQQVDPNTGALVHDFTDAAWNTRFLGDLYQDLSEATRKRYALLQTPEFVEEFILDRTLTPAIREFGFREVRMIDPTCGSGHFLLGGFQRLLAEWQRNEPGRNPVDLAQRALDAVAGVDLNPFAVAISRFRLLVAALQASGVQRLANAHDFKVSVAIGDSLLHGTRFGLTQSKELFDAAESHLDTGLAHAYASEDLREVQRILGRQYHAVVGNPPYIVVKDAALNAAYRRQYASCHRQYSLGAPFTERFFELALSTTNGERAGHVGLITANSFMKREFGSKLIEQVLPRLDLTHVVDTSGAYIPGHGTPTVILFGRHRAPVAESVRTVMGIKGEPNTPADPAQGQVWSAIVRQIDEVGSESDFVSVADTPRTTFSNHPWSIGGGGVAALRELLEERSELRLGNVVNEVGFGVVTREDDAYSLGSDVLRRHAIEQCYSLPAVAGDNVRDWTVREASLTLWPYVSNTHEAVLSRSVLRLLWPMRAGLSSRVAYGKTQIERGLTWFEYSMFFKKRFETPLTIAFAEISTHNHFVLDRGGKVFKQTAPVIKLPAESSPNEHLGMLGLLNSSVACFWLKQVCHNKGEGGGTRVDAGNSALGDEAWKSHFAFNSTKVAMFPLCAERPIELATRLDALSLAAIANEPDKALAATAHVSRSSLDAYRDRNNSVRRQMVAAQEELDWQCYRLYGLLPSGSSAQDFEAVNAPELQMGERAFEIVLARRVAAGDESTSWFERHNSTPTTTLPSHWPADYRAVVERRIALINDDLNVGLIERPEFKRRWKMLAWHEMERTALRDWLLARLEDPALWPANEDRPPRLASTNLLADDVSRDAGFMQIAALYAGRTDFDLSRLLADLVTTEAVPILRMQRYTETGLRKRAQWEETWMMQRREDAIDAQVLADNLDEWRVEFIAQARQRFNVAHDQPLHEGAQSWADQQLGNEIKRHQEERKVNEIGVIPMPPKYQGKDFLKADYWRLRGSLDVPKERFISFPGAERGADGSLPIAWAGWSHLQLATALAGYYVDMKDAEGWEPGRLQQLLAGLLELVPWLKQWHNDIDPAHGERMGDYYESFVAEEARALGFTLDDLRSWKPLSTAARRGRKAK